jgi:hypothetical protein
MSLFLAGHDTQTRSRQGEVGMALAVMQKANLDETEPDVHGRIEGVHAA